MIEFITHEEFKNFEIKLINVPSIEILQTVEQSEKKITQPSKQPK